jgi:hypothetical protein
MQLHDVHIGTKIRLWINDCGVLPYQILGSRQVACTLIARSHSYGTIHCVGWDDEAFKPYTCFSINHNFWAHSEYQPEDWSLTINSFRYAIWITDAECQSAVFNAGQKCQGCGISMAHIELIANVKCASCKMLEVLDAMV